MDLKPTRFSRSASVVRTAKRRASFQPLRSASRRSASEAGQPSRSLYLNSLLLALGGSAAASTAKPTCSPGVIRGAGKP